MGEPELETLIKAEVSRTSNSGNPVIKRAEWNKEVVVVVDDSNIREGDTIEFIIQREQGDHYVATACGGKSVSLPEYDSTPNMPIHHDGKSVGSSRSTKKSFESVEEKEFNPKTHNAPKLESERRERKHLNTSDE